MRTLALLFVFVGPPDPWFGADKLKHFLISAMMQSTAVSVARAAGVQRNAAQIGGAVVTFSVGVGREVHDRRAGRALSLKDLLWDGLGGAAAASLLNGAR
jgi:uncharacterized protein YfiM (DUF2279 family)